MLKKKLSAAINDQINAELFSSYLYLSMGSWFESKNLKGAANWMKVQAQEELTHAMKFFAYVCDRGERVVLKAIDGPATEWKSPLHAFEEVLKHEQKVTSLINKLMDLAIAESDHATQNMLQWFIAEQVEEEASADAVIQQIKLAGDNAGGLFMIDRELGARVFTPPTAAPIG